MRISKQARRRQILEVAANLIEQNGFNGIVTKDLADKADISDTLIFRHFGSLENLYREVCETFIENIVAVPMDARINSLSTFIREFACQFLKANLENPRPLRLLTRAQLERPAYVAEIQKKLYHGGTISELEYQFKKEGYNNHKSRQFCEFILTTLLGILRNHVVYGIRSEAPDPDQTADFLSMIVSTDIT